MRFEILCKKAFFVKKTRKKDFFNNFYELYVKNFSNDFVFPQKTRFLSQGYANLNIIIGHILCFLCIFTQEKQKTLNNMVKNGNSNAGEENEFGYYCSMVVRKWMSEATPKISIKQLHKMITTAGVFEVSESALYTYLPKPGSKPDPTSRNSGKKPVDFYEKIAPLFGKNIVNLVTEAYAMQAGKTTLTPTSSNDVAQMAQAVEKLGDQFGNLPELLNIMNTETHNKLNQMQEQINLLTQALSPEVLKKIMDLGKKDE